MVNKKDCFKCRYQYWWGNKPRVCILCNDKYSNFEPFEWGEEEDGE